MTRPSGFTGRQLVEALPRFAIVFERRLQMRLVLARIELWQEGSERRLDVPHEALVDSRASAEPPAGPRLFWSPWHGYPSPVAPCPPFEASALERRRWSVYIPA